MKKIIIAGGTGFIGQSLSEYFKSLGHEVIIIARKNGDLDWRNFEAIVQALNNANLLINLAGKSVNCRYNAKNKAEIFDSRTRTTQLLGDAIRNCPHPPALWINSSTATIYRHADDRPMSEDDGEIGTGFSVEVAQKWEKTFFDCQLPKTRQVALRLAIVLGKNGGVMIPFENLVTFGLGGKQGDGRQMFSWIHIEDVQRIIDYIEEHTNIIGILNCSSPNPIDNSTFMQTFRRIKGRKIGFPSPKWMLQLGAILIGTETELLLKSRWVIPTRLTNLGFKFKFPDIDTALRDILTKN